MRDSKLLACLLLMVVRLAHADERISIGKSSASVEIRLTGYLLPSTVVTFEDDGSIGISGGPCLERSKTFWEGKWYLDVTAC